MHTASSILRLSDIFQLKQAELPEEAGVYAFWWVTDRSELLTANRHIVLKGPNGADVEVEYEDWWPSELAYPCLYVGKTTNVKKRCALHIKSRSLGRLHVANVDNAKAKPRTSSCQLRWGIEHVFPHEPEPLKLIFRAVGFSYRTDFPRNPIAERFFEEDRLVGTWRPWFNIDSER